MTTGPARVARPGAGAVRVRLRVGECTVDLSGMDLTLRQVRALLADLGGLAATLPDDPAPERAPVGFAAPVLERLPDDLASEPGQ